jgi:hypothetical protein
MKTECSTISPAKNLQISSCSIATLSHVCFVPMQKCMKWLRCCTSVQITSHHTVCIVQRNFTHLIRCQTMKVNKEILHIYQVSNKEWISNTSRKHVNYEEDKITYPWTSLTTSKIRIFAMVLIKCVKFLCSLSLFDTWLNV